MKNNNANLDPQVYSSHHVYLHAHCDTRWSRHWQSFSLEEHGSFKPMDIHNSLLHLMPKASS